MSLIVNGEVFPMTDYNYYSNQIHRIRTAPVHLMAFKFYESIVIWFTNCLYYITKTRLYNSDPLEPHFYIVKLGFTGVYIIFLISA